MVELSIAGRPSRRNDIEVSDGSPCVAMRLRAQSRARLRRNPTRPRMIGRTIGKYRIVGQLGRGGAGIVYKAVDETLNRDVAVKTLNPDLANTEVMSRFRAEATILAKLNHPQIATIFELFRDGERPPDGDGVRARRDARQAVGAARPDRTRSRGVSHRSDSVGARARASRGRRPPRRQARERDGHQRGQHQDHGLRHRARVERRAEDRGLPPDGDAGLHVARAGDG